MGYHWIRLVKQALNPRPDQVQQPPCRHQGPEPWGLRYRGHPDIESQCQNFASIWGYGLSIDWSDQGETKFNHFWTLPIHKCTMCDFPNFSTRSNNSRFTIIFGVYILYNCSKWLRGFQNCINHFSTCPQCREHTWNARKSGIIRPFLKNSGNHIL